jgi:hypothetical protein
VEILPERGVSCRKTEIGLHAGTPSFREILDAQMAFEQYAS